jgi:hypothetical protein
MKLIDKCLDSLNSIYQFKSQILGDESIQIDRSQTINEDSSLYEASNDGLTLKISPIGRRKICNKT